MARWVMSEEVYRAMERGTAEIGEAIRVAKNSKSKTAIDFCDKLSDVLELLEEAAQLDPTYKGF